MHNTVRSLVTFLILALFGEITFAGKPKFSDQQIMAMTPHYFRRSREAPEFLGVNIYRHPQRGKVFRVELRGSRNQENEALGYAFSAMLNLSQYFRQSPDLFVVVIHSDSHGIPPIICTGDAQCTANHFIYHRITYKEWYNQCISFEGS